LSLQGFNAKSLMTVILTIRVLEKGVHHKRVYRKRWSIRTTGHKNHSLKQSKT
jgi:hypothetical protein